MRSLMLIALLAAPVLFARPASAADAEANWTKHCASCHGKDGMAQTKMGIKNKIKDMTTAEWQAKNTDAKNQEAILNGVKDADGNPTKMKSFKEKLTKEEVVDLVKYVRAFKK